MPKLQFSGLYKSAKEIPPKQLMDYYLKGDQSERREAGNEIFRRLEALDAKDKQEHLSLKEFIANYLYRHEKPYAYRVRWLCSSEEHRKKWIDKAIILFEAWRKKEIEMKEIREI